MLNDFIPWGHLSERTSFYFNENLFKLMKTIPIRMKNPFHSNGKPFLFEWQLGMDCVMDVPCGVMSVQCSDYILYWLSGVIDCVMDVPCGVLSVQCSDYILYWLSGVIDCVMDVPCGVMSVQCSDYILYWLSGVIDCGSYVESISALHINNRKERIYIYVWTVQFKYGMCKISTAGCKGSVMYRLCGA